jgi:hypothetical protein
MGVRLSLIIIGREGGHQKGCGKMERRNMAVRNPRTVLLKRLNFLGLAEMEAGVEGASTPASS